MELNWTLASPLYDIDDIIKMGQQMLASEEVFKLKTDPNIFRKNLTCTATYQLFDKGREFLAVCRDENEKLLGYCWYDRGGYTTYSAEEISNAKFHHVDLTLPVKTRVKLINQMIDQHVLWCNAWGIPIICSTSIRSEHDGFMKIHHKRGFQVNGSYAWCRTEDAMKCLTK